MYKIFNFLFVLSLLACQNERHGRSNVNFIDFRKDPEETKEEQKNKNNNHDMNFFYFNHAKKYNKDIFLWADIKKDEAGNVRSCWYHNELKPVQGLTWAEAIQQSKPVHPDGAIDMKDMAKTVKRKATKRARSLNFNAMACTASSLYTITSVATLLAGPKGWALKTIGVNALKSITTVASFGWVGVSCVKNFDKNWQAFRSRPAGKKAIETIRKKSNLEEPTHLKTKTATEIDIMKEAVLDLSDKGYEHRGDAFPDGCLPADEVIESKDIDLKKVVQAWKVEQELEERQSSD